MHHFACSNVEWAFYEISSTTLRDGVKSTKADRFFDERRKAVQSNDKKPNSGIARGNSYCPIKKVVKGQKEAENITRTNSQP